MCTSGSLRAERGWVAVVMARRSWVWAAPTVDLGGVPWAGGSVSWRATPSGLLVVARRTASHMAGANGASRRAVPSQLLQAGRPTSDELTVLYSNGPDDRSVKLALGYAPLHRSWKGQTVSGGGLLQWGCRRHGPLQGAWWWQALPARGLPYGCTRQHAALQGARQTLPARGLPQVRIRRHAAL
jgi:hypothetical protein